MKTISVSPKINFQPKTIQRVRNKRWCSNSITLDSNNFNLENAIAKKRHLYYLKLHDSKEETNQLPPILKKQTNQDKCNEKDSLYLNLKKKNGKQVRCKSKVQEILRPQETFYIYHRDSLTTDLKFYNAFNHSISKERKKNLFSELQGEQKTVYEKSFPKKIGDKNKKTNPKRRKQIIQFHENKVVGKNQKWGNFTPWSTILQNDHD